VTPLHVNHLVRTGSHILDGNAFPVWIVICDGRLSFAPGGLKSGKSMFDTLSRSE